MATRSTDGKVQDGAVAAGKQAPPAVPEFLPQVINCHEETHDVITGFASREKIALVAIIAPRVPVRISPAESVSASIGLLEEFGVEALVNKLRESGVERAYMLVNSPGGGMHSSYKIALAVRSALKEVTTFVPHVAASGGTLLALAGNEIVMGPMSHITPLDSQVYYNGAYISAASSYRFYQRATEWFEKQRPEEAPYPQRALTDKLNPYLMEEWNGVLAAMADYVNEILGLSGYSNAAEIAGKLVFDFPTHSYVLNAGKAASLGLNVVDAGDRPEAWKVMRFWLSEYVIKQEMTHCIRYVVPETAKTGRSARSARSGQKGEAARKG